MMRYCLEKWDKNRDKLEENIRLDKTLNDCAYIDLVKKVVDIVLNGGDGYDEYRWSSGDITEIDNGDYQGTLLFLIPTTACQPSEGDYLMTYVGYGSCSWCDTLQGIKEYGEKPPTEQQVKDFMELCKDILCNMVKPYNHGWRNDEVFEHVTVDQA